MLYQWYFTIYHSVAVALLVIIIMFNKIGGDIANSKKNLEPQDRNKSPVSEIVLIVLIFIIAIIPMTYGLIWLLLSYNLLIYIVAYISMAVFLYLGIKELIILIFCPRKGPLKDKYINDFIFIYVIFTLSFVWTGAAKVILDKINRYEGSAVDFVSIGIFFVWYFLNIIFILCGIYVFLFYLSKIEEKLSDYLKQRKNESSKKFTKIYSFFIAQDIGKVRIMCVELLNSSKNPWVKIILMIPMMLCDILSIWLLLIVLFIKGIGAMLIVLIIGPLRDVYNIIKKIWNRHDNSAWMYLLCQIAGLISFVIVYSIIIQSDYDDLVLNTYQFIGSIILIPYFLSKIISIGKNPHEKKNDASNSSEQKEKSLSNLEKLQSQMTYNEDGEGVIGGKTIRQLEKEAMEKAVNNKVEIPKPDIRKLQKNIALSYRNTLKNWIKRFINQNIEILIGILITAVFIGVYFSFRTNNQETNGVFVGSLVGGIGAIISILLSISYSKRSNAQALDSTVLPYLKLEKYAEPFGDETAYEFINKHREKFTFPIWREFDFETISSDKRTIVRNGIAYLSIKNIGLGPALKLNFKIENFSSVYLKQDFLSTQEEIHIILNFNNPDTSCHTSIIIEYETIRGIKHRQVFDANITWHMDRTNFTLFR